MTNAGEAVDVAVVGAGQAGLATSHWLGHHSMEHEVLEAGEVADSWRKRRWDSFNLITPNWTVQLPGMPYAGPEPDGFMTRAEVIDYFDRYRKLGTAPIALGTHVIAVDPEDVGFRLTAEDGRMIRCRAVVVATGAFQRPHIPLSAASLPASVQQLHTSQYRNPSQIQDGAVLVIGSGQSGCQIAEELRRAGRDVYLSIGSCGWAPRRYRGRDIHWWLRASGMYEDSVDSLPSPAAKFACNPQLTGADGGRELNVHTLAAEGVVLLGRWIGAEGGCVEFDTDVADLVANSDRMWPQLRRRLDGVAERLGIDADDPGPVYQTRLRDPIAWLNAGAGDIAAVIWATGYRPDFGWIHLPVLAEDGYPRHRRGISEVAGLYFVGLNWLHNRASSLIYGVGQDAEHIAVAIRRYSRAEGQTGSRA